MHRRSARWAAVCPAALGRPGSAPAACSAEAVRLSPERAAKWSAVSPAGVVDRRQSAAPVVSATQSQHVPIVSTRVQSVGEGGGRWRGARRGGGKKEMRGEGEERSGVPADSDPAARSRSTAAAARESAASASSRADTARCPPAYNLMSTARRCGGASLRMSGSSSSPQVQRRSAGE